MKADHVDAEFELWWKEQGNDPVESPVKLDHMRKTVREAEARAVTLREQLADAENARERFFVSRAAWKRALDL